MLTNGGTTASGTTNGGRGTDGTSASADAQKVVIVNGSAEMVQLLDTLLDAGRYDIVFVESNAHAYSRIKRVQPHLVILCVRIEDSEGFQVLSMLKLDEETRKIPVLTYTTEYEGQEVPEDQLPSESEMFAPKPALPMN